MNLKFMSCFMIMLVVFGSFAPFATAAFGNAAASGGFYSGGTSSSVNTWQSSRPTFDGFYAGSMDTYWPILSNLKEDQCDSVTSDFIIAIPPMGCSPTVVRSDLLAEQNVPVFCQLSAIRVNPLIDVSTIKSISFKGDYPEEVAGISFHPAKAAVRSYKTLIGSPIEENIGYVVIVLKRQPDERNLEEYVSGMLTASVRYDAEGSFGVGAAEYYLEPVGDDEWNRSSAAKSSFWAGKGYVRAKSIDDDGATLEVLTDKDSVYRTVTLKEGETSNRIYYPGQYCTAAMKLKLNKIDNSEDMARIDIDGDNYWVRKGSRLLGGKCTVRDLNVFPGSAGEIEIACSGEKTFKLELANREVVLNNGTNVSVMIGGSIKGKDKKDYYLGYYGSNKNLNTTSGEFVVLFNDKLNEDDVSEITRVFEGSDLKSEEEVASALLDKKIFRKDYSKVIILGKGVYDSKSGITFDSIKGKDSSSRYDAETGVPKYLKLGRDTTMSLIDDFGSEKKENGEAWGENALYEQIKLAREAGDSGMQEELIQVFLRKYPKSASVDHMRDLKLGIDRYDLGTSSKNIFINNYNYNIRVSGFVTGGGYEDTVDVHVNGRSSKSLKRSEIYDGSLNEIDDSKNKTTTVPRLTVVDIDGRSAKFSYSWRDADKDRVRSTSFTVSVGDSKNVGGTEFKVSDTNVKEVAYVSLIPEVRNTKTEANFTFKIGIEKRLFEISPEAAKRKVKNLNKSIAEWEDRIEKLGGLIKGLKAACFATSTVLTLKTMFSGFVNGEALARERVMSAFREKCRAEGAKSSVELQKCYSSDKYKDQIAAAIANYGSSVSAVNKDVKCAENATTVGGGFLETKVVNTEAYVNRLSTCATLSNDWSYTIGDIVVTKAHLTDASDYQAVLLKEEACKKPGVACDMATAEMRKALSDNLERINVDRFVEDNNEVTGVKVPAAVSSNKDAIVQKAISAKGSKMVHDEKNYLVQVYDPEDATKRYYMELTKDKKVMGIYDLNGEVVDDSDSYLERRVLEKYSFYIPASDDASCTNKIASPFVRYHEENNKQGFAAVVPFDLNNGWYAYVDKGDYTESGVANAFWICSVGGDGTIDNGPSGGKDKCVRMSSSIGSNVLFTPCPKKSSSEIKRMYSKAEAAIREANRNGQGITVDGKFVSKTSPIGPASSGIECSDFMSVEDCNLMFNVCDPVICPTSRCDLGGAFPVADVIQSGIIGSIALCLPNFGNPADGGVAVPICLSGVHAGLDSYVSILKSHRDCLVRNIETGEYTGICDEITAVYMCEFFWGQISPILDHLAVKFVEAMYTGFQTRGGAEYLTIQKSFDNVDKSVDYFTSNYAAGAFRAFDMRSVEEVGGTVCKGFVGSSVPTSADALDSLLEPESPPQFYAYFSESLFSEATVPSSSHYKVYYHIYAGNDRGAQYRVYLKNPPESSYYSTRQILLVDSGYAAKGIAADEAADFTAPSGYKELCVSINGQDECGFGSVTSDFGLNYASQAFVADQADDRAIQTTEDCVTTSTSMWGMVNPNLQAGAEKSISFPGGPQNDIADTGLVRICASSNPEQGIVSGNDIYCKPSKNAEVGENKTIVNPSCGAGNSCKDIEGDASVDVGICHGGDNKKMVSTGRWADVGYCDTPTVRCWLDSTSVKENLDLYAAVNGIDSVEDLARNAEDLKALAEQYKDVMEKLRVQKDKIEKLKGDDLKLYDDLELSPAAKDIILALDQIAGVGNNNGQGSNANKAEALFLKVSVYRAVVEALRSANPHVRAVGKRPPVVVSSESESSGGNLGDVELDYADELKERFPDRGMDIDMWIADGGNVYDLGEFLEAGILDDVLAGDSDFSNDPAVTVSEPEVEDGVERVIDSEIEVGFVLNGDEIRNNGGPTGMKLVNKDGTFYNIVETSSGEKLGTIINGVISVGDRSNADDYSVEVEASLLIGWRFDDDSGKFEFGEVISSEVSSAGEVSVSSNEDESMNALLDEKNIRLQFYDVPLGDVLDGFAGDYPFLRVDEFAFDGTDLGEKKITLVESEEVSLREALDKISEVKYYVGNGIVFVTAADGESIGSMGASVSSSEAGEEAVVAAGEEVVDDVEAVLFRSDLMIIPEEVRVDYSDYLPEGAYYFTGSDGNIYDHDGNLLGDYNYYDISFDDDVTEPVVAAPEEVAEVARLSAKKSISDFDSYLISGDWLYRVSNGEMIKTKFYMDDGGNSIMLDVPGLWNEKIGAISWGPYEVSDRHFVARGEVKSAISYSEDGQDIYIAEGIRVMYSEYFDVGILLSKGFSNTGYIISNDYFYSFSDMPIGKTEFYMDGKDTIMMDIPGFLKFDKTAGSIYEGKIHTGTWGRLPSSVHGAEVIYDDDSEIGFVLIGN